MREPILRTWRTSYREFPVLHPSPPPPPTTTGIIKRVANLHALGDMPTIVDLPTFGDMPTFVDIYLLRIICQLLLISLPTSVDLPPLVDSPISGDLPTFVHLSTLVDLPKP